MTRYLAAAALPAALAAWVLWPDPTPPPAPSPEPASPPASAVEVATPPPAVPPQPAASAEGLVLYGVSGAAAIIGSRLGGQRVVPVGRDYRLGLTLEEVGVDHAVLRSGAGATRLELARYGAGGSATLAAALPAEAEQKIEAAVLRNILRPAAGGYALGPGESLPQFLRAGLRPGDVITSVNGSQLDAERMGELAWQMGNASKTEFIFLRNGKKMRAIL